MHVEDTKMNGLFFQEGNCLEGNQHTNRSSKMIKKKVVTHADPGPYGCSKNGHRTELEAGGDHGECLRWWLPGGDDG